MREVELARARLREIAGRLEDLRRELLAVKEDLPGSPEEEPAQDLDPDSEPDPALEIRNVVDCTLHDNLEPLIRDLRSAAEYQPEGRALAGGGEP